MHKVEDIVFKLINNYPLVKLETDFRAKSLILVDKPKIKRVVEIILDNAYEAIKHKKNENNYI